MFNIMYGKKNELVENDKYETIFRHISKPSNIFEKFLFDFFLSIEDEIIYS